MYWLRKYFSDLPGHTRALTEVLIVLAFSILPFGVTAFVRSAKSDAETVASISDLFSRGQIFLLAYALFGTVFWLAFVRWDRPRHNARTLLGVLAVFLVIPIIGFIGVDPTFSSVVNARVVEMGYWFYGGFVVLHYLLLFFSDVAPPEPSQVFDREASAMQAKYEEFRRGE